MKKTLSTFLVSFVISSGAYANSAVLGLGLDSCSKVIENVEKSDDLMLLAQSTEPERKHLPLLLEHRCQVPRFHVNDSLCLLLAEHTGHVSRIELPSRRLLHLAEL